MSFREIIEAKVTEAVDQSLGLNEATLKVSNFTGKIADKAGFKMKKVGDSNPGADVIFTGDEKAIISYARKYLGTDGKTLSDIQRDVAGGPGSQFGYNEDFNGENIDAELLERIAEMTDDEFDSFCQFCVEAQLDELSPETLSNYRKKAFKSYKKSSDALGRTANFSRRVYSDKGIAKHTKIADKRHKGIGSADKRSRARSGNDHVGRWDLDKDAGYHTLSKKTSKQMQKIKGYGKDQSGKNKIVSPNGKVAYVSSSEIKDYIDRGWKRSK